MASLAALLLACTFDASYRPPADAAADEGVTAPPPKAPDARSPEVGALDSTVRPRRDAAPPPVDAAPPPVDAAPIRSDAAPPRACAVDPRPPRFGARIDPIDAEPGLPLVVDVTADVGLTWVGLSGAGPTGAVRLRYQSVSGNGPFRWRFEGPVAERGRYCLVFTAGPAEDAPDFVAARGFEAD
ncbi:MAG: hypothetical protein H6704_31250 [Myxococcales bacterium]|nr:hypothetical protein [Myxococcales bacterium]